jgi:hypothetical protein
MSAPADIMSRNRYATRTTNMAGVWFKSVFAKLYIAIDESQRKRAAKLIRRYDHLINRDEKSGEQKQDRRTRIGNQ